MTAGALKFRKERVERGTKYIALLGNVQVGGVYSERRGFCAPGTGRCIYWRGYLPDLNKSTARHFGIGHPVYVATVGSGKRALRRAVNEWLKRAVLKRARGVFA